VEGRWGRRAYGLVLAGVLDRAEIGERVGPVLDVVRGQLDEHPLQRGRGQVDVTKDLEDHITVGSLSWGVDGQREVRGATRVDVRTSASVWMELKGAVELSEVSTYDGASDDGGKLK
jgi:hypothetical protein